MSEWKRSAVIIAVAQSTFSLERKYTVKPQGENGIEEGSLGLSDKNDNIQEPPGGGS